MDKTKQKLAADNCQVVTNFRKLVELTPHEREVVATLAEQPMAVKADEFIRSAHHSSENLYLLNAGWACCSRDLADGSRQILDVYLPGQILGLRELGFKRSQSNILALTDVEVCPFPKKRIFELIEEEKRLADIFLLLMAREEAILIERIINIGRRSAEERLANFIIELQQRVNPDSQSFELPMTQEQIGDALGMTSVHVCRMFSKLEKKGLIKREGYAMTILLQDDLWDLARFNPDYLSPDLDWIRPGIEIPQSMQAA